MIDWAGLLARKYDILQQDADAREVAARAGAGLDNVRAGLLPADSRAENALRGAQAGLASANAGLAREETRFVGDRARADIFATRQQGSLYGAQATGERQMSKLMPSMFRLRGLGDNLGRIDSMVRNALRGGLGPFGDDN